MTRWGCWRRSRRIHATSRPTRGRNELKNRVNPGSSAHAVAAAQHFRSGNYIVMLRQAPAATYLGALGMRVLHHSVANHQVDMFVKVKDATPDEARWIYKIRNIYLYPKFSLKDTSNKLDSAVKYRWYNVIDPRKTVRPFVFKNSVLLHPGDTYNRTKHNASA